MSFNTKLTDTAQLVNRRLQQLLAEQGEVQENLKEALSYILDAPGKRVRSVLVLWCCELISGNMNHNAELAAAAIEMVHTYSLVHDDFRRGQPTCHKAFDEATAILAGDGLLTLPFEILARDVGCATVAAIRHANLNYIAGPAPKGRLWY